VCPCDFACVYVAEMVCWYDLWFVSMSYVGLPRCRVSSRVGCACGEVRVAFEVGSRLGVLFTSFSNRYSHLFKMCLQFNNNNLPWGGM
jgi:hypothetical protein